MGQRNRTVNLEMDHHQSQASLQQEPDHNNMVTNIPNLDNSAMYYGPPPHYHHQHPPTNYYVPYVTLQGPSQLLPSSSSNHGLVEYERNPHTRGTFKRKNPEGNPFNIPEPVAPFVGPPPPPHAPNSFIRGNYHHPFQPHGSIWYDQQHHGTSHTSPSFWPHAPYMHGNIAASSIDSSSRNPMYPSQLDPRDHYYSHHHHHHLPAPPPGQSTTLYPHMASSTSYRVPPGNFGGPGLSHRGPVQPNGFHIYQHHQRDESIPLATLRQQHRGGVSRLRMMPDDEVAILEYGDFHIDHHRDMRLDIEEMSYEELLALSERIGTVNTGLPEEVIKKHLKTRTCFGINHKEDIETEPCTICQERFKNKEKIATLDCGHEYHVECLEKWLIVKNVCPICKSEALVMEKRKLQ